MIFERWEGPVPERLYHITPASEVGRILREGLRPQPHRPGSDEIIYLSTPEYLLFWLDELPKWRAARGVPVEPGPWVVLEVRVPPALHPCITSVGRDHLATPDVLSEFHVRLRDLEGTRRGNRQTDPGLAIPSEAIAVTPPDQAHAVCLEALRRLFVRLEQETGNDLLTARWSRVEQGAAEDMIGDKAIDVQRVFMRDRVAILRDPLIFLPRIANRQLLGNAGMRRLAQCLWVRMLDGQARGAGVPGLARRGETSTRGEGSEGRKAAPTRKRTR